MCDSCSDEYDNCCCEDCQDTQADLDNEDNDGD